MSGTDAPDSTSENSSSGSGTDRSSGNVDRTLNLRSHVSHHWSERSTTHHANHDAKGTASSAVRRGTISSHSYLPPDAVKIQVESSVLATPLSNQKVNIS